MSLINDLMIEIDRREKESRGEGSLPVDGLMPNLADRSSHAGRPGLRVGLAASSACALALALWLVSGPLAPPVGGEPESEREAPPSVSARPALEVDTNATPSHEAIQENWISGLTLERGPRTTSLLIATDSRAPYRIEGAGLEREIEIVIEETAFSEELGALDLSGTPIRSIQTQHDGNDFRIRLALEKVARIQSRWLDGNRGPTLSIDIDSPARAARAETPRQSAQPQLAGVPVEARLPEVSSDRPRAALQIGRSADDRRRVEREVLLNEVAKILREARIARSEGAFDEAIALYQSALSRAPDHREAVLELTQLFAEAGDLEAALELVTRARRTDPSDPGFLMLEASFAARRGDLAGAVALLDGANLALADAPKVHALAAAYVQQMGDHGGAILRYETVLRRYPNEAVWWMGLGISLEARDRFAEAIDVYRIAMQVGELSRETRLWISGRVSALAEKG